MILLAIILLSTLGFVFACIIYKQVRLITCNPKEEKQSIRSKPQIKNKNKLILETQKLTIQFLKKEKIYEKYMFYFKNTDHIAYYLLSAKRIKTFADYVKYEMEAYHSVSNLLNHAFNFSLTKEGSDFWLQKSILLKTYVENESNKTIHTISKRKQSL